MTWPMGSPALRTAHWRGALRRVGHTCARAHLPVCGVLAYHHSMHRDILLITLLYVLAALAVVIPISTASWLAEHESRLREQDRAAAMANELLQRTDKITEQLRGAFKELRKAPEEETLHRSTDWADARSGPTFQSPPRHWVPAGG